MTLYLPLNTVWPELNGSLPYCLSLTPVDCLLQSAHLYVLVCVLQCVCLCGLVSVCHHMHTSLAVYYQLDFTFLVEFM